MIQSNARRQLLCLQVQEHMRISQVVLKNRVRHDASHGTVRWWWDGQGCTTVDEMVDACACRVVRKAKRQQIKLKQGKSLCHIDCARSPMS
jgi:hypothetical protein